MLVHWRHAPHLIFGAGILGILTFAALRIWDLENGFVGGRAFFVMVGDLRVPISSRGGFFLLPFEPQKGLCFRFGFGSLGKQKQSRP
jgi:hypothetical protein